MIKVDRSRYPLTVLTLADRPSCDVTVFAAIRQLLDGWPSTAEILGAATLDAVECELDAALERELFRVRERDTYSVTYTIVPGVPGATYTIGD